MAYQTGRQGPPVERVNLYQQIIDRIIFELELGRVPWAQPWGSANAAISEPPNAVSERRYSGINILTLSVAACDTETLDRRIAA